MWETEIQIVKSHHIVQNLKLKNKLKIQLICTTEQTNATEEEELLVTNLYKVA